MSAGEFLAASEPVTDAEPPARSQPPAASEPVTDAEPPTRSQPPAGGEAVPANEAMLPGKPAPAREPLSPSEPLPESAPPIASESPPGGDPPHRPAQAQTFSSAGRYATVLRDGSLIVIGAALFLCALATLSLTWAWSWHAGPGRTFNLSHMHGICTSAMGELAQGASANVASHCLWVDGTWTEAVALTGGSCILAGIGIARILRRLRAPT